MWRLATRKNGSNIEGNNVEVRDKKKKKKTLNSLNFNSEPSFIGCP